MVCPYCKKKIEDTVIFCPECGQIIKETKMKDNIYTYLQAETVSENAIEQKENKIIKKKYIYLGMVVSIVCILVGGLRFSQRDTNDGTNLDVSVQSISDRINLKAPKERVYDYAEVLTEEEENNLCSYIAENEEMCKMDIVLVTIKEDVESKSGSWENSMKARAVDFYESNQFGYNMINGDGVLLLDNWYNGQAGSYFITSGAQITKFTKSDIENILDVITREIEEPYKAYKMYVDMVRDISIK